MRYFCLILNHRKIYIVGAYISYNMAAETITISREEYLRLKKCEEVDQGLLNQLVSSLEDIKAGRLKRVC